jgi:Icc-related predicted phosphoesterase
MRIVFISDTHTRHRELKDLPKGDVIVHAGDIMNCGYYFSEVIDFAEWYGSLPYKHKILIGGNHDRLLDDSHMNKYARYAKSSTRAEDCEKVFKDNGITYLNDSGVTIKKIKFWGSPIQPEFFDWAFNRKRGADIKKHWDLIPNKTDVLITHGPPYGLLDLVEKEGSINQGEHVGCEALFDAVIRVSPKIHCFGHIHSEHGEDFRHDIKFVNAAVLNDQYKLAHKPIEIEINNGDI